MQVRITKGRDGGVTQKFFVKDEKKIGFYIKMSEYNPKFVKVVEISE